MMRALMIALLGITACARTVGEDGNGGTGDGEPNGGGEPNELPVPAGDPETGVAFFEITVSASIDPPAVESDLENTVLLFHCGAAVWPSADDDSISVELGHGIDAVEQLGAVAVVEYGSYGHGFSFGSAGPYNTAILYETDGTAIYPDVSRWYHDAGQAAEGTFPLALDVGRPAFRFAGSAQATVTLLAPDSEYDPASSTVVVRYDVVDTGGQSHAVTETYAFSGEFVPVVFHEPPGCD
jgi:hypothetical protein